MSTPQFKSIKCICSPCRATAFVSACPRLGAFTNRLGPRRGVLAKGGLGDDLLDYIQAGPKLRKWYGETDKMVLPKDGGPANEPEPEGGEDGPRDAILVTDADTPMGELIVLQLVLSRARTKVLVADAARAKSEFGPYVEAISGDVNSGSALKKAFKSVRAVIIPGATGQAVRAAAKLGAEHVVLLSTSERAGGPFGGLFGGPDAAMRDPARLEEVRAAPVPHTVIQFGRILDRLGGNTYIEFGQAEGAVPGPIAREDAALVAVRALAFPPPEGSALVFQAGGAGAGAPPERDEWKEMFANLQTVSVERAVSG